MPPKILRYDIFLSDQAPALAKIEIQSEAGTHSFLINRQTFEALGHGLKTAPSWKGRAILISRPLRSRSEC
jgi:hypothetical protein